MNLLAMQFGQLLLCFEAETCLVQRLGQMGIRISFNIHYNVRMQITSQRHMHVLCINSTGTYVRDAYRCACGRGVKVSLNLTPTRLLDAQVACRVLGAGVVNVTARMHGQYEAVYTLGAWRHAVRWS
jgi:hypothetical protein